MLAAQSGANVIYGAGMLENGLCVDFGKMVLDCDAFKMIKHVIGGISMTDESMAINTIKEVGIGGNFLSHEHTLKHCRTAVSQPNIFDRRTREDWVLDGGKDIIENAYEKAIHIIDNHEPMPLPDGVADKLREIITDAEMEYGVDGE